MEMTLRDTFAAAAIQSLLISRALKNVTTESKAEKFMEARINPDSALAERAYAIADAMLEARSKGQSEEIVS